MSIFGNQDQVNLEQQDDEQIRTGGGNSPWESGVYDAVVKLAYFDKSKGGANSLKVVFELNNNGDKRDVTITEYFTSGEAKGFKHYYVKDGKNFSLPGYAKMDSLSRLLTEDQLGLFELTEEEAETKTIKVYDFEQKKELPQEKRVFTAIMGVKCKVAVVERIANKQVKNPNSTGTKDQYIDGPDKRHSNEVDMIFNEDGNSWGEVKGGQTADTAKLNEWTEKKGGKPYDTFKVIEGAQTDSGSQGTETASSAQVSGMFSD